MSTFYIFILTILSICTLTTYNTLKCPTPTSGIDLISQHSVSSPKALQIDAIHSDFQKLAKLGKTSTIIF